MSTAEDRIFAELPTVEPSSNGKHPTPTIGWPVLAPAAFHGIIGEFVNTADPYTEADSAAGLVSALVMAGTTINRGPHALAGNEHHPATTYAAIVGATAKGGKGTSYAVARSLIAAADPDFARSQIKGGFGSGEKVVDTLRDRTGDGARDTRLLVYEPELALS